MGSRLRGDPGLGFPGSRHDPASCLPPSGPVLTSPARLLSVNVARPVDLPAIGSARPTAIDKRPVTGEVAVHALGLEADEVGDTRYHGGPDKAVYAFAREDLDLWSVRLGSHLPSGSMSGENLTTTGIDVNESLVGERWRIGTTPPAGCDGSPWRRGPAPICGCSRRA